MKVLRGISSVSVLIFSIGLVLTMATQLRFGSLPIGIGECILVTWMIFSVAIHLKKGSLRVTKNAAYFVWFFMAIFFCFFLGSGVSILLDVVPHAIYHNYFAFAFSALLVTVLSMLPLSFAQARRVVVYFTVFQVFLYGSTYLLSRIMTTFGPLEFFYGEADPRFLGFAVSPNQAAFTTLMVCLLSLYLAHSARTKVRSILFFCCFALMSYIGFKTKSDAFSICWIIGVPLWAFAYWLSMVTNHSLSYWRGAFWKVWFPVCVILVLVISAPAVTDQLIIYAQDVMEDGDQGEGRFTLWVNSWEALKRSPFFGLGPGPHSGFDGPFEDWEAHNTLLDLLTYGGFIGVLILNAFIAVAAWRSFEKRGYLLCAGLILILMFSQFHFTFRYPIIWFFLFFLYVYASTKEKYSTR